MVDDRRYEVFISSTFSDLESERRAAIEAVYEAGHIPIALERFPPVNATNIQVIRRAMETCQIYVLILGHRYGEIVPDGQVSYTEYEYELAREYKLHLLTFILDNELARKRRKELDERNERDHREIKNAERRERFLAKVKETFHVHWTPESFKYWLGIALAKNVIECKKPGFIREPEDPTVLDTAGNEFIVDIVSELKGFTKLYERCHQNTESKRALTSFFVEEYMDTLIRSEVNLFFESGSTIAFLAKQMATYLKGVIVIRDGVPNISITTNNVLAYLLLWLRSRIPCSQFPWSPPFEATYGALYAGIAHLAEKHPDYRQPPLDPFARAAIAELLAAHFAPRQDPQRLTLLLGTASGLQLQEPREIRFTPDVPAHRRTELAGQIKRCFGPHVGSYHNKVFKRFMYATGLPIVLFADSDKVDCPVDAKKCHYILDAEFDWEGFLTRHPVAFCIGCAEPRAAQVKDKSEIMTYFRDRGFEIIEQNHASAVGSFIARNAPFIEQFEKRCVAFRDRANFATPQVGRE